MNLRCEEMLSFNCGVSRFIMRGRAYFHYCVCMCGGDFQAYSRYTKLRLVRRAVIAEQPYFN